MHSCELSTSPLYLVSVNLLSKRNFYKLRYLYMSLDMSDICHYNIMNSKKY